MIHIPNHSELVNKILALKNTSERLKEVDSRICAGGYEHMDDFHADLLDAQMMAEILNEGIHELVIKLKYEPSINN